MSDTRLRFTGLTISALAMCGLMAYGCKKAERPETAPAKDPAHAAAPAPQPAAAPAAAKPADPAPAAKPADMQTGAMKPAAPAPAEPAKKPPIPHTELAQDAKPLSSATLPGGVLMEEHKVGEGDALLPGGGATFHLVGRLKDGWKIIQDTYADGEPISAAFRQMLPGLADGLVGMRPGGVRRLTIPPELGFADRAIKNDKGEVVIPAGSTLVYDVELVAVRQTFVPAPPPPEPVKIGEPAPDANK